MVLKLFLMLSVMTATGMAAPVPFKDVLPPGMGYVGQEAIVLGVPQVIGGQIDEMKWSSDGRYLLIRSTKGQLTQQQMRDSLLDDNSPTVKTAMETEIRILDTRSGDCHTYWTGKLSARKVMQMEWMQGENLAFAAIANVLSVQPDLGEMERGWILHINPRRKEMATYTIRGDPNKLRSEVRDEKYIPSDILIYTSPSKQIIMGSYLNNQEQRSYLLFSPSAKQGKLIITNFGKDTVSFVRMSSDGFPLFKVLEIPIKKDGMQWWYGLNADWELEELAQEPKLYDYKAPSSIPHYAIVQETRKLDGMPPIKPLWIEVNGIGKERVLIAMDAKNGEIAPSMDKIAYITAEGALCVRQIFIFPKELLEEARLRAIRKTVDGNAKQLGIAMIMYAQDYDEQLPSEGDISERLIPYVRNEELLQGFVYTFPGGAFADIAETSQTMLGYIPGPGGYALIFADGHVEWSDKLPE